MSEIKPSFQVRRAIDLLNQQTLTTDDTKLICDRVLERFGAALGQLYKKWLTEHFTTSIEPYRDEVQQLLRLVDPRFTVIGTCRRPFMFHTRIGEVRITFKVTTDYVSYSEMR